jgi:signal peptidase I
VLFGLAPPMLLGTYRIPSASTAPTIQAGDHLLVNRAAYRLRLPYIDVTLAEYGTPKRGDIVVFKSPRTGEEFIKRVAAVSGDRVAVDEDGTVRIDGATVPRCRIATIAAPQGDHPSARRSEFDLFVERQGDTVYLIQQHHDDGNRRRESGRTVVRDMGYGELLILGSEFPGRPYPRRGSPEAEQGGWAVPSGEIFVLGDNRDNSNDSRFWGTVPTDLVVGKAWVILRRARERNKDRWVCAHDPPDLSEFEMDAETTACVERLTRARGATR